MLYFCLKIFKFVLVSLIFHLILIISINMRILKSIKKRRKIIKKNRFIINHHLKYFLKNKSGFVCTIESSFRKPEVGFEKVYGSFGKNGIFFIMVSANGSRHDVGSFSGPTFDSRFFWSRSQFVIRYTHSSNSNGLS